MHSTQNRLTPKRLPKIAMPSSRVFPRELGWFPPRDAGVTEALTSLWIIPDAGTQPAEVFWTNVCG